MELWRTAVLKLADVFDEIATSFDDTLFQIQLVNQYCIDVAWNAGPASADKLTTKNTLDDRMNDDISTPTDP